jgi:hypothetical protein
MHSLNDTALESNKYMKINFNGGDLSSDAGLLLFKEFLFKIGAVKLINRMFKTNDTAWFRIHKDEYSCAVTPLIPFYRQLPASRLRISQQA